MSKLTRKKAYEEANEEVIELEDAGHQVTRFTDWHWRIDDKIDVWPGNKKYMKLDGFYQVKRYEKLKDILT